jgi:PAS domain S-box-containing protein
LLVFFDMLKFYLNKRILVGFSVALGILSWLAITSYQNKRELIRSNELVVHTIDVLYNTERALSITTNIELGQRGYAVTGNEAFLRTYEKAAAEIHEQVENLRILTFDNPNQRIRIEKLKLNINRLLTFADAAVCKRKISFELARDENATLKGKEFLDAVRAVIADIEKEENELLHARNSLNDRHIEKFNLTFISLLGASGVILVCIFYAINVTLKARLESENRLTNALTEISDLYDNAPCGYHSLDKNGAFVNINNTLCQWLGYSKSEIVNRLRFSDIISDEDKLTFQEKFSAFKAKGEVYGLEFCLKRKDGTQFPVILSSVAITDDEGQYIKSRSITIDNTDRKIAETQIKNLNQELEAFTYSVSHDLRAPLRSIDGYARILQEDYAEKLDTEGKRVLSVVMNNAKRMGKLIDDLLDFARLGRKEIVPSQVDMNIIVAHIANELIEREKNVDVKIQRLHNAPVDIDMIRQVWENLISNAIKYSAKQKKAIIEISSEQLDGEVLYKIKDNGVGFEMQYVNKLFGVFQRLHKIQDFAGTGVGLAIVKRIIDRHKGRVWAEGKVDRGATFYFTIPNENGK